MIEIPSEEVAEVKESKRISIEDIKETGNFYAAINKKGEYKRYNEDRVIIRCNC